MVTIHPSSVLRHTVERTGLTSSVPWWRELVWVPVAAALGFANAAVLVWWLEASRSWFVLGHAVVVGTLTTAYVRQAGLDPRALLVRRWPWALAGTAVFGTALAFSVLRQDAGTRPEGLQLGVDLLWLGVVYGLADALLLNVIPVLATWRAFRRHGWTSTWTGKVGVGALAIAASLIVTAAYHYGFPEYHGTEMRNPLIGGTIITLSHLVTANPLTAMLSHVIMHITAVLHGANGTTQLPPHY